MKNFINTVVLPAIILGFAFIVGVSPAAADEPKAEAKVEAKDESKTEAKTEAPATKTEAETPTVRQGLKFVDSEVSAKVIHHAVEEIEDILDEGYTNEEELKKKLPNLLKVEADLSRLENSNALRQDIAAALKRGIVARAAGVDEAELRLGTPRSARELIRHTAAEQELDELLNPTMWDKLKWWWKG